MPRGFALRLRIRQKDPNFRRNYVINVHITCNDWLIIIWYNKNTPSFLHSCPLRFTKIEKKIYITFGLKYLYKYNKYFKIYYLLQKK